MFRRRSCRSASRVDVVGVDRLSDDIVSGVCRMREFGVRLLLLHDLLGHLALHLLEVLGELLFGKFFAWLLHRASPASVPASLSGRDPWPTPRLALLSAAGCMRLHPHTLYDLRRRSVAGASPASAHADQTPQYSKSAAAVQSKPFCPYILRTRRASSVRESVQPC